MGLSLKCKESRCRLYYKSFIIHNYLYNYGTKLNEHVKANNVEHLCRINYSKWNILCNNKSELE